MKKSILFIFIIVFCQTQKPNNEENLKKDQSFNISINSLKVISELSPQEKMSYLFFMSISIYLHYIKISKLELDQNKKLNHYEKIEVIFSKYQKDIRTISYDNEIIAIFIANKKQFIKFYNEILLEICSVMPEFENGNISLIENSSSNQIIEKTVYDFIEKINSLIK